MIKVLIVATHPDDETLGCGGTILKHKDKGDQIYWLIITNIDEKNGWNKKTVAKRQEEIENVSKSYGFEKVYKLNFPTVKLDTIPMFELISSISKVMNEVKPHTIYLPNRSDVHTDHQISFKAVWSCTKNFRYPFIKRVLMYECLTETEFAPSISETVFSPNVFIDITKYINKKLEIMKIYKSELMDYPAIRSNNTLKSLAAVRGSRIGKEYSEAFMLIEEIND